MAKTIVGPDLTKAAVEEMLMSAYGTIQAVKSHLLVRQQGGENIDVHNRKVEFVTLLSIALESKLDAEVQIATLFVNIFKPFPSEKREAEEIQLIDTVTDHLDKAGVSMGTARSIASLIVRS